MDRNSDRFNAEYVIYYLWVDGGNDPVQTKYVINYYWVDGRHMTLFNALYVYQFDFSWSFDFLEMTSS